MPLAIDWEGLTVAFENRSQKITHFFDRESGDVVQVLVRDAARHAELSGNRQLPLASRSRGEDGALNGRGYLGSPEALALRPCLGEPGTDALLNDGPLERAYFPQPLVPTTARKQRSSSRASMSSICASRPKNRCASSC